MYEKTKTPNCLPTNNPSTIPSGTLSSSDPRDNPSNETPAFANANKGIIPNATYGLIACSILINNENFLINRGWIPFEKKDNPEINIFDQNNIIGTLKTQGRKNIFKPDNDIKENYWFSLNREDILKFTGKKFSKYIIYLDGNYQFPRPKKITANISNNHKKYAMTWLSLAISILSLIHI